MTTPPTPAPPLPPPPELDAIKARLEATQRNIWAMLRAPAGTFHFVGHNELTALNADLNIVRALNASIRPHHKSRRVAAWPDPVLPMHVLLAPRDLLPAIGEALGVFPRHRSHIASEGLYAAR